jgi:hypothetical protein
MLVVDKLSLAFDFIIFAASVVQFLFIIVLAIHFSQNKSKQVSNKFYLASKILWITA